MACSTQALSIGNIVILHDKAVHRISEAFRVKTFNGIPNRILTSHSVQEYKRNDRKAIGLQELLLCQFAVGFQLVADQLKSPKFQHPLFGFTGIQFPDASAANFWGGYSLHPD